MCDQTCDNDSTANVTEPGQPEPLYEGYFDVEFGVGAVVWIYDSDIQPQWGNLVRLDDPEEGLPISEGLRQETERLGSWYENSLGGEGEPLSPWRQDECDRFNADALAAFYRVRDEIAPTWVIECMLSLKYEDPRLDRELAEIAECRQRRQKNEPPPSLQF